MTKFSIIIPTYNRAWCIERAIESVLRQDFQDWEMIIIDDGSTDNTRNVIKKYLKNSKIKYFYKENGGVGSARNFGIEESHGEVFVFFDSDDTLIDKALEKVYEYLNKFLEYKFFLFGTSEPDGKKMYFMENKINKIGFEEYIRNKKVSGEMIPCLRREVFIDNKQLRFPEEVNGGEGILWYRLIRKYPALCVDEVIRLYNKDANNSLVRQKLDKEKACNILAINRLIIKNFESDLYKYNKKYLSTTYFVMANMFALIGEKKNGFRFFLKGLNLSFPSIKNLISFMISLLDVNFFLYNLFSKLYQKIN
jgi:glycosyltransferase involved in cell wall biosynthesis